MEHAGLAAFEMEVLRYLAASGAAAPEMSKKQVNQVFKIFSMFHSPLLPLSSNKLVSIIKPYLDGEKQSNLLDRVGLIKVLAMSGFSDQASLYLRELLEMGQPLLKDIDVEAVKGLVADSLFVDQKKNLLSH